jgi:hypothetical protein
VNIAQVPAAPTIMSVYDREKQLDNVGIDGVVIFDILWKLNYTETIKPYLDAGYKVVLNLEFVETFPNLNATATGRYDKWLYDFAWQVTNDGRPITIRPLHEFNGKLLTVVTLYFYTKNNNVYLLHVNFCLRVVFLHLQDCSVHMMRMHAAVLQYVLVYRY